MVNKMEIIKSNEQYLHVNDNQLTINVEKNINTNIYKVLNKEFIMFNIELNKNAVLNLLTFNDFANSNFSVKAYLKRGATLNIYNVILSEQETNVNQEAVLAEEGSTCHIVNVIINRNKGIVNNKVEVYHPVKHTTSLIENYAIAEDESKINLDNNATIKQKASGSDARQMSKGLTIGKNATIKAQPNLFIDEYDVTASHSASIGSLNQEDLFYLMSRGLPEAEASRIMTLSYIQPLLDQIKDEKLREEIFNSILKSL